MKTQQLTSDTFYDIVQMPQSTTKIIVQCSNHNPAKLICINKLCQRTPIFICYHDDCPCNHTHKQCPKASIQYVTEQIKAKIVDTTQIKSMLDTLFDQVIDELSILRENLSKQIEENLKYALLTDLGKQFLRIAFTNQTNASYSPKDSEKLWAMLNKKQDKNYLFNEVQKIMKDFQKKQQTTLLETVQAFKNFMMNHKVNSDYLTFNEKYKVCPKLEKMSREILNSSSIVKTTQQVKDLLKFFPSEVKTLSLMYKASENDFSMKNFIQNYGQETHTLFICKTNKNKVVGAYTPLSHEFTGKGKLDEYGFQAVRDSTGSTFIFSLTTNDKFLLLKPQEALERNKLKTSIKFGKDLRIVESANMNLCAFQTSVFDNPQYSVKDKTRYEKFHGNSGQAFTIKQWEIWKVSFL